MVFFSNTVKVLMRRLFLFCNFEIDGKNVKVWILWELRWRSSRSEKKGDEKEEIVIVQ